MHNWFCYWPWYLHLLLYTCCLLYIFTLTNMWILTFNTYVCSIQVRLEVFLTRLSHLFHCAHSCGAVPPARTLGIHVGKYICMATYCMYIFSTDTSARLHSSIVGAHHQDHLLFATGNFKNLWSTILFGFWKDNERISLNDIILLYLLILTPVNPLLDTWLYSQYLCNWLIHMIMIWHEIFRDRDLSTHVYWL